ncbi:MAG: 2-(1,2-epoxy,2-dihydrophenyl)acetyl-CoA isomerase, partial [Variibacter sp.]|nr:2-(1,2-epoxy,2-dihydrophenyl)acetyl-CoA isomerase [Variibacter sp.]
MTSTIRFTSADGVATITLARPDKLNAIVTEMHAEIRSALDTIEKDDAVRCVVFTGEGRAFSSGQDLGEARPIDG